MLSPGGGGRVLVPPSVYSHQCSCYKGPSLRVFMDISFLIFLSPLSRREADVFYSKRTREPGVFLGPYIIVAAFEEVKFVGIL